MLTIGVLALQGDFAEHAAVVRRLGADAREVRSPENLRGIHGLIIPGGESTTITRLMAEWSLAAPIVALARDGMPLLGTCAGLIVMAQNILDDAMVGLDLFDIDIQRNGFGRQVDSFEQVVDIPAFGEAPFRAVFIRAPLLRRTGSDIEVLASLPDGAPIAVRKGNLLGCTFHPELTPDLRFHALLLRLAKDYAGTRDAAAI